MQYRITCVFTAVTEDSAAVTHVGGIDAEGARWKMSVEEAAEAMAAREVEFLLEDAVLAAIDPESERLLRLPACP